MSDLENLADIPDGAVVRADPADEEGDLLRAILALSGRPALRARLGAQARRFVAAEHSRERCRQTYTAALERTVAAPAPAPAALPPHWRPDTAP
jgi:hypothetical protein